MDGEAREITEIDRDSASFTRFSVVYSPWGLIPRPLGRLKTVTIKKHGSKPHCTNRFLSNDRFFAEKSDTPLLAAG
jgi:hypothetical protein